MPLFMDSDEDDEKKPYSSVSNRGSFDESGLPPPPPNSTPANPTIKEMILNRMNNPLPADQYSEDPSMKRYEAEQGDLNQYRQAKINADTITNVGQALAQVAQGTNAPRVNQDLFQNIQKQNENLAKSKEENMDRRAKIINAIEARKARETISKGSKEDRELQRTEMKNSRLDRLMAGLGTRFENDPLLKTAQLNLASLEKAKNLLNNTNIPLTSQALSDAEQDIASALSLRGQGATEGKIKRTEIETIGRKIAELKQKIGNRPVDLRKDAPEIVGQIQRLNNALYSDYIDTINKRRGQLVDSESTLIGDKEAKQRLQTYKKQNLISPPESPPPSSSGKAGQLVRVKGKLYRVGPDGDSLEEVM